MIYPIVAYGAAILRKKCQEIDENYPNIEKLINDMFATMYDSYGCGLAAPQINIPIRVFVVDSIQLFDRKQANVPNLGVKKAFINPILIESSEEIDTIDEGCLSIPKLRADVQRALKIKLKFLNEQFQPQVEEFHGINARVILHEYDHIEGILFIDRITSIKKKLWQSKLKDISKGKVDVDYKMIFIK